MHKGCTRANRSIGCTATECRYHTKNMQQCSLGHIHIVKHKVKATIKECIDCGSFEKRIILKSSFHMRTFY
ncbi:DUF1540 domain-containing protein [Clostridiaceae bacterium 35-E11]